MLQHTLDIPVTSHTRENNSSFKITRQVSCSPISYQLCPNEMSRWLFGFDLQSCPTVCTPQTNCLKYCVCTTATDISFILGVHDCMYVFHRATGYCSTINASISNNSYPVCLTGRRLVDAACCQPAETYERGDDRTTTHRLLTPSSDMWHYSAPWQWYIWLKQLPIIWAEIRVKRMQGI